MAPIQKGMKAFEFASLALFAGAFSTYANLYMTQPVLPTISKQFGVSPAVASLSLSLTTMTLAMAYLSEEIDPSSLNVAIGLYISGNSIGGLAGRIIMGSMSDLFNWHIAMITIGVASILLAIAFYFLLPKSQNFTKQKLALQPLFQSMTSHLKKRVLISLSYLDLC